MAQGTVTKAELEGRVQGLEVEILQIQEAIRRLSQDNSNSVANVARLSETVSTLTVLVEKIQGFVKNQAANFGVNKYQ